MAPPRTRTRKRAAPAARTGPRGSALLILVVLLGSLLVVLYSTGLVVVPALLQLAVAAPVAAPVPDPVPDPQ